MPIVYITGLIMLFYLLYALYQLTLIIIWPIVFGWLVYIAGYTFFIKAILARFRSKFVELIELDHSSGRFVFKLCNDSSKAEDFDKEQLEMIAYATAFVCYLFYANEMLLKEITDGFWYLIVSVVAFSSTAAGLYAAIRLTQKSLFVYLESGLVKLRIFSLNAQAAHFEDFSREVSENSRLRVSLQAHSSVALSRFLTSIVTDLPVFISGGRSLQSFIDKQTAALRTENQKLSDLCGKYASLQGTYDFACRRANHVGNEAVFRILDNFAEGIAALAELINQSRWDEFSQLIDGAQEELKNLLENIEQLESGEDASSGAEIEENNDDPYAVLGVRADLSNDEIRKVYRLLANIYHPDRGNVSDHGKFQQLQQAWAAICKARNIR